MGDAVSTLGDKTYDIYLNDRAYWSNVPANGVGLQARGLPGAQEVAVVP